MPSNDSASTDLTTTDTSEVLSNADIKSKIVWGVFKKKKPIRGRSKVWNTFGIRRLWELMFINTTTNLLPI